MEDQTYEVIIIGAGPGGYLAAERARAQGKKVLLIEKDKTLGGVCLNRGCIPTKTLLNSAKIFYKSQNSQQFGVNISGAEYNLTKAMDWKKQVITTLTKGVAYQMKRHNVTVLHGTAKFIDRNTLAVDGKIYTGNNIIIATGSSPAWISIPGADLSHVLSSDQILEISSLPKNLVIVGGGVIGLEFASYFSMLGINVTIIEMLREILPSFDTDMSSLLCKSLSKCKFITNAKVVSIDDNKIYYSQNGKNFNCKADLVLIAVGRTPNTEGLGLEDINLDYNQSGIRVNEKMQTNLPNVYAIGDVTGISLLAHSAYRMGEVAVNVMFGKNDRMRYNAVPWVVYSNPEISSVGITEKQALRENREIKISKVPLRVNGRFLAEYGDEQGMCKVIVDAQTNALMGVTIIGGVNSEIIYGAAAMIEAELRVADIKEILFPHPTVSEVIKDSIWEMK